MTSSACAVTSGLMPTAAISGDLLRKTSNDYAKMGGGEGSLDSKLC